MLELAQIKGEYSNLGVYRAQAKEVPTLKQTVNSLSAKILTTEKELTKYKLELQSYKMNQQNVPIEHVPQQPKTIIDDEDSLLVKARERWAEMSGVQSPQKPKEYFEYEFYYQTR